MAGRQETIYVAIEPATYGLAPRVVGAYTDRGAAERYAEEHRLNLCQTLLQNHYGGETASSDGIEDKGPEVKKTKTTKKAKVAKEDGASKKVSKRTAVPQGYAQALAGQTYMLAGTLHQMDHKTFTQTVELHGGTHTTKLDDADILVIGANPGKKSDDASDKGVHTIDEEKFFDAIGVDYPEPPAKRAKK